MPLQPPHLICVPRYNKLKMHASKNIIWNNTISEMQTNYLRDLTENDIRKRANIERKKEHMVVKHPSLKKAKNVPYMSY